jgi:DNA-directed RNA polymerase specialized sigma24 family protein
VDELPDDELLIATPRSPAAFGTFYRRHERTVFAYFMHRTGDPELAADLAAETFAAVLIGADRYRPQGQALAWLFGIARHKLLRSLERGQVEDRARRRLGMPVLELEDDVLERIAATGGDERVRGLLS